MKVLVHYSPSPCLEVFEGARLRKTIKALCEKAGIAWVDGPLSSPDIAHFISLRDEAKLRDFKEAGVKTVVSAFYCEHDPEARLLRVDERGGIRLPNRSRRFLDAADLVLVPSENAKTFCLNNGVSARVEVLRPSLHSYLYSEPESELNAGLRYFAVRPEEKVCVTLGSYKNRNGVRKLYEIASCLPDVRFFFFGAPRHRGSLSYSIACATAPENCRVFRLTSALSDLSDWEKLVVRCQSAEEAVSYLKKFYAGQANETIIPAASYAKGLSVNRQAANLSAYYTSILEGEKHD